MTGFHESKITNACVASLANSLAIDGDRRLGLGYFEAHANSSRINQHFPEEAGLFCQRPQDASSFALFA